MILLFATIITLAVAAPNRLDSAQIANDNHQAYNNDLLCETPACVHAASSILENMDSNVDPCDNFYKFACGKFVEQSIIPNTSMGIDTFQKLNAKIEEQLHQIIPDRLTEDDLPIFKLMKTYYETCMDTEQIEKNSEKELREDLKKLGGCPILEGQSWNEANFDWKKSIYESNKIGYATDLFFQIFITADPDNSDRQMLTVDQARTELPHKSLMTGKDDEIVTAFTQMVLDILEFLGVDRKQAENEVDRIVQFEIALAKNSLSDEERRDATKLNNRMTLQQLETNYNGTAWAEIINEILAPYATIDRSEEIIVANPSYFKSLAELIGKTPKRVLANYVCINAISEAIDYMGEKLLSIVHQGNIAIGGAAEQNPRKKVCFKKLSNWFYLAIGRLYVKHYFDKNTKPKAANLIENLRNSMRDMIDQSDWLDNETKPMALKKLNLMTFSAGYPDELDNDEKVNEIYENLKLDPESFLRSELALKQFEKKKIFPLLSKPQNETSWIINSATARANAAYYLTENSFDLPAGILQGHFYDSDRPNYMNYAAIGAVIGHEMSHAFDDEGSQYDEKGNLFNWWKNETRLKYLDKAKCIIEQYGNYTVKEVNMTINGINTQGENIADNIGLKAAYLAYNEWAKKNSKEPLLPGLNYKPQQMFWINFANNWCAKIRPERLKQNIVSSTHAPQEFRVIGTLSNIPEFSRDFQCPLESSMNPAKKCSMW